MVVDGASVVVGWMDSPGHCSNIMAAGSNEHGIVLLKEGRESTMSYRYANRFAVVAASEMEIVPGDRLQLKFNGKSAEGAPLHLGGWQACDATPQEASARPHPWATYHAHLRSGPTHNARP